VDVPAAVPDQRVRDVLWKTLELEPSTAFLRVRPGVNDALWWVSVALVSFIYFVGALLGARMGLREPALFFFAVGSVHYVVLFVTLYQRLPTNVPLPRDLHPVFFLFVATPSVASVAWARISGEFGLGARVAYYVARWWRASASSSGASASRWRGGRTRSR
jgi:hypothetical protein